MNMFKFLSLGVIFFTVLVQGGEGFDKDRLEAWQSGFIDKKALIEAGRKQLALSRTLKALKELFTDIQRHMLDLKLDGKVNLSTTGAENQEERLDVTYRILCTLNQDAYANFVKDLKSILTKLATDEASYECFAPNIDKFRTVPQNAFAIYVKEYVNYKTLTENPKNVRYTRFIVPEDIYKLVQDYLHSARVGGKEGIYRVKFSDSEWKTIHEDYVAISSTNFLHEKNEYIFTFDNRIEYERGLMSEYRIYARNHVLIAPVIGSYKHNNQLGIEVETQIRISDLERIERCQIELLAQDSRNDSDMNNASKSKVLKTYTCYSNYPRKSYWGITLDSSGVAKVEKGSVAEKAGIRERDYIESVYGIEIDRFKFNQDSRCYRLLSLYYLPGEPVKLGFKRYFMVEHETRPSSLEYKTFDVVLE